MNSARTNVALLLAWLLASLMACATLVPGATAEGRVIEEGTHRPVAGVMVVGRWIKTYSTGVETVDACVHVETTTTDAEGRYQLPRYRGTAPYHIDTYKPGYGPSAEALRREQHWPHLLAPFTGGREERLEYLTRVISSTSCGDAGTSYKNLYRIRRGVYEEASGIAQSVEEKKRVERFKEIADDTLVDRSKPTKYDERGRLINVNPKDTFRPEEFK